MASDDKKMSGPARFAMGLMFILCGAYPILAVLGVEPFVEGKRAPDWVVGTAGVMFVMGGIVVWFQETGWGKAVAALFGFAMLFGLAAIANWVAFGPGERGCSGSLSIAFGFTSRAAGELECRSAFGIGAGMMDAIVLLVIATQLKGWFGPLRIFALLEKLAWGVLLVALSPLLLVLFVVAFFMIGKEGLLEKAEEWIARRRARSRGTDKQA
jgi:hypothetical protein